jgi:hypothetical protein
MVGAAITVIPSPAFDLFEDSMTLSQESSGTLCGTAFISSHSGARSHRQGMRARSLPNCMRSRSRGSMTSIASVKNINNNDTAQNDINSSSFSLPDISLMEIYASSDLLISPTIPSPPEECLEGFPPPPAGMSDDVDDMLSLDSDCSLSLMYSPASIPAMGE